MKTASIKTKRSIIGLLAGAAFAVVGCRLKDEAAALKEGGVEASADEISEAKWRDKVSQRLRYGSRMTPAEEDQFKDLSRPQFIEQLMKDPRFALTMLDFNMDFMGRQVDHLVVQADETPPEQDDFGDNGSTAADNAEGMGPGAASGTTAIPSGDDPKFNPYVFSQPQALASASAFAGSGGDYFDFFDAFPKLYIESPAALAYKPGMVDFVMQQFDTAIAAFGAPPADDSRSDACYEVENLAATLSNSPYSDPLTATYKADPSVRWVLNLIGQNWVGKVGRNVMVGDFNQVVVGQCADLSASAQTMVDTLSKVKAATKGLLDQIDAKKKPPTSQPIVDLVALDLTAYTDLPPLNPAWTFEGQWKVLKNSSTNVNRKRAAYILRTFTCDDMTPVSLGGGGDHAEGAHASQPACQACHYKMDPIGAVFAPYGVAGVSFAQTNYHIFDDALNVAKDSEYYTKKFINSYFGTDGKMKIGHYKSADKLYPEWTETDPSKVTMATLLDYFKRSNVARACLTKRLTEYMLGKKQVYDGKWVATLAKNFTNAQSGTDAVKKTITDVLMSNTFKRQTIVPGQCYDFAPGGEPGPDTPPCEVNSIVQTYCSSCHNADNASGDLDVTKWVKTNDGYMFAHYKSDANTDLVSRKDSLKWIIATITDPKSVIRDKDGDGTPDPLLAMPYKKDFPESEKQILFKWLQKQLSGGN